MGLAPFAKGEIDIAAIVAAHSADRDGGQAPFPASLPSIFAAPTVPQDGVASPLARLSLLGNLEETTEGVLMEALATQPLGRAYEDEPRVLILVADDDRPTRSLLASCAREVAAAGVVLEAEDGAEAIQLGLQRKPEIAVLDVDLPRLGGIEAAVTLRELQPRMRLALQSADPLTDVHRARASRLPLFSKLDLDRTGAWLHAQVQWCLAALEKHHFACAVCGYGVVRAAPPERCPMCQTEHAWTPRMV
jgi:CheY-like chemotaxis protein